MPTVSKQQLKHAILTVLASQRQAHKINLIGRENTNEGALEQHLGVTFEMNDRSIAARAFEELKKDGYLQSTFTDIVEPENWVAITDQGRDFLKSGLKDKIDHKLEAIGPQLLELRRGMLDAVGRTSPDAPRQAAHSARELMDQLLKLGAPVQYKTRRERFRFMMERNLPSEKVSKTDESIIDATWKVVEAELNKLLSASHSRANPPQKEVQASVNSIERILALIFGAE